MEKNRYENGKIYKVVDVGYNKCYIGSTCESLSQRMSRHRISYKHFQKNGKSNVSIYSIFDEYGVENCKIELIQNYPCNHKTELCKREGECIKSIDCVNKAIAGRSRQEWNNENVERRAFLCKRWRQEHKEYLKNKYESQNIKTIKLNQYHLNKEEINERRKKTYKCECGINCRWDCRARHERTKRHQKYIGNLED